MSFPTREVARWEFPPLLTEIPDIPKKLFVRGQLPQKNLKLISVVGSRKYTTYGQQVVERLVSGLKGYPVGIVSGLALGIDALAHRAALSNNLYTLAVPGSGIEDSALYPATNRGLARQILETGGGLMSEFEPTMKATKWTFPARNRIMAGLTHATLLIEAAEKSGTLITARLATDYNRELLVVPGNIFSQNSQGVHQFLKLGATPVTDSGDILECLGIAIDSQESMLPRTNLTENEKQIIEVLIEPKDIDTLIEELNLSITEANVLLMQMEMKGLIINVNGQFQAIV